MRYEKIVRMTIDTVDYFSFEDVLKTLGEIFDNIPGEDEEFLDETSNLINALTHYIDEHLDHD